jgi:hypothetical protein
VFLDKDRTMDNVQQHNICTNLVQSGSAVYVPVETVQIGSRKYKFKVLASLIEIEKFEGRLLCVP